MEGQAEAYALKAEPSAKPDEPKAQALKPPGGAAEASGAWRASGIDGAGPITPEMRGDIAYGCSGTVRACVDLLEGIGATGAELRDAARRAYADDVERGRHGPYRTRGLGPFFPNKVVAKLIHVW